MFFSENSAQHWTVLDEFEDEGYVCSPVQAAFLETGECLHTWIYSLK
ncbi:hypothetical protein [Acinetobacter sp. ANC 4910]|nr:hypothetical protein [Acinetobacter sp. ANC 4910]